MSTTPRAVITLALKKSGVTGVGQVASVDDLADAFTDLNMMLAQWSRRRWIDLRLSDLVLPLTGVPSYTIGTGATLVAARPDRIEAAYVRLNGAAVGTIDYPLQVLGSREDYNDITLKRQGGYPAVLYYDPTYPIGTIFIWPVGNAPIEVHLTVKGGEVAQFATLDDTIMLPDEYQEAILYNLAVRLRASYQIGAEPIISALAVSSLATIRAMNTQIEMLKMPSNLPGMGNRMSGGLGGFGLGSFAGGSAAALSGGLTSDVASPSSTLTSDVQS